jgi:hypothetical protein
MVFGMSVAGACTRLTRYMSELWRNNGYRGSYAATGGSFIQEKSGHWQNFHADML